MSDSGSTTREARFRAVFSHLGDVIAYARRRGSADPEAIAAEAMTVAWRKLDDVPADDPRPWLYATAKNLLHEEWRRRSRSETLDARRDEPASAPAPEPQ